MHHKAPFDTQYTKLTYERGVSLIKSLSGNAGFIQFGAIPDHKTKNSEHFLCSALPIAEIRTDITESLISKKSLTDMLAPYKQYLIAGLLPYELGLCFETSLHPIFESGSPTPSLYIGVYDWCLCFDNSTNEFVVLTHSISPKAQQLIDTFTGGEMDDSAGNTFTLTHDFTADLSKEDYLLKINKVQSHINSGDCYQINLAQRFTAHFQGHPWEAYSQIASTEQGRYCAYMNLGRQQVLSFSPEQFIEIENRKITTKPIKGTRPTSSINEENEYFKAALKNSTKDRAENLMIVDLLRNDLGKICETGSVSVPRLFDIESFDYVHHLVSTVTGRLKAEISPIQALFSMFPGGSITGAPKIKAMEIINSLESFKRNAYCGSIFFLTPAGYLNSSITIRTLLCDDNTIYCYGGGGIVADSNAEDEYDETINKVGKFMKKLEGM